MVGLVKIPCFDASARFELAAEEEQSINAGRKEWVGPGYLAAGFYSQLGIGICGAREKKTSHNQLRENGPAADTTEHPGLAL